MLLRRLLLFASLLFVMAAIASAVSPRDRKATAPPRPQQALTTPGRAIAAPGRSVTADLPGKPVRVRVGDIVSLSVRAPGPEQVDIPGLGLSEPADLGLPAAFDFVAPEPGRYDVRLGLADRSVGAILVGR